MAASIRLKDWIVDPSANELQRASGERVRVQARAMKVLELLHSRAGTVVSADDILASVWKEAAVTPHSVAIVISDLRKALGDDSREPRYIETVPKRGYRLISTSAPAPLPRRRLRARLAGLSLLGAAAALFGWQLQSFPKTVTPAIESTTEARYLRARELWNRREHESVLEARRMLEEILAEREDFAAAHAALADLYAHKTGEDLGLRALDTFRLAQRHLDRALALDPDQPELYVTRALLDFYRDEQPEKALGSLDEALRRDPRFALAWQTRAMVLSATGQHEAALEAIARAAELDTSTDSIRWDRVWLLYVAREYARADEAARRAQAYSRPNYLYQALIAQGRGDARGSLDLWIERFGQKGVALPDARRVRAYADRTSLAAAYRELLRQVGTLSTYRESPAVLAVWQTLADEPVTAIATLSASTDSRDNWMLYWLEDIPAFASLRGRPEARALVARQRSVRCRLPPSSSGSSPTHPAG